MAIHATPLKTGCALHHDRGSIPCALWSFIDCGSSALETQSSKSTIQFRLFGVAYFRRRRRQPKAAGAAAARLEGCARETTRSAMADTVSSSSPE